jgi:DNA topoisomerase-3
MSKLVIAEKHSVGQSIADVLGAKKKQDGYLEGNGYIVSWCVGHLVEMAEAVAYDEKYAKWRYGDLPIIPAVWKNKTAPGKTKQLKILSELMKRPDVETVVCATDAGREGELIFRLVYEYCKCKKNTQRLWISSMEDETVRKGFAALKPGSDYDNLYQSALCRARADWLIGINATRAYSCTYNAKLNVGRVQSPTLAMIVARDKAIGDFVKEPFYTVELDCGQFTATGEKMKNIKDAEFIRAACDGKTAVISGVKKQEKTVAPPRLYDLTTLQREANRMFGHSAQKTLDIAQSLYEKKLATYPRTDSKFITEDMAASVPILTGEIALTLPFVGGPVPVNAAQIVNNAKVSDHHAILPTLAVKDADLSALTEDERDILRMISVRLVTAVNEKHVYEETAVTVNCEGGEFKAKGKTVLQDGWKAVDALFRNTLKEKTKEDGDENKALPQMSEGQTFSPVAASVREGFTTPPKHYTEDTLLAAMETAGVEDMPEDAERKGLGTPATRAGIIEKLVKTGFVERQKKLLVSTDKAAGLIAVLPDTLTSPVLTAEWEHKLKRMERGEVGSEAFMDGIADMTRTLVAESGAANPAYAEHAGPVAGNAGPVAGNGGRGGESVGKCPRCGSDVSDGGKGYFCGNKDCTFVIWKDNKYFTAKKKKVTKEIAAALLNDGRVAVKGLYSEKKNKTYDATIVLDDTGKYVNFKMEFDA